MQDDLKTSLEKYRRRIDEIRREIRKNFVGQHGVVREIMATLFSRSHCFIVGVPGLAKTTLVRTLASALALSFRRIQFTPDMMPSDVIGTEILDTVGGGAKEFRFASGPIFAHLVLADEINRTPPRTQAALLEAMQERQVTVGGKTYALPNPFFVLATQNPIEQEGTYPLPEAQLDRFMFAIRIDYPAPDDEAQIYREEINGTPRKIEPVLNALEIVEMQRTVDRIVVSEGILAQTLALIRMTRPGDPFAPEIVRKFVDFGASPRAGLFVLRAARAFAAMEGRPNVAGRDIFDAALPVLRHRIGLNFRAEAEGVSSEKIVAELTRTLRDKQPPAS